MKEGFVPRRLFFYDDTGFYLGQVVIPSKIYWEDGEIVRMAINRHPNLANYGQVFVQ